MRELNTKVAECLGWERKMHPVHNIEVWVLAEKDGRIMDYLRDDEVDFLTGNGMLLLIEEARKQGWTFVLVTEEEGYECTVFNFEKVLATFKVLAKSAPLSAALAFLKANGIDIMPYVGVEVG